MIARHEGALRRTALRYSFDPEDAEDAYQRALEIVLTKAPTTNLGELIRWTQTVTKHEALAVRQSRRKLLRYQREGTEDPVALIPAGGGGPDEQVERREDIARSREALQRLKPAELRALSLLAEGYSYVEIGERTGWSRTKINRLLAEGRAGYRALVSSSEDGSRCRELRPLLSAYCDGEAGPDDALEVREHLRACGHCRSTMRTYRAAPRVAAALLPLMPPSRSLLERAQEPRRQPRLAPAGIRRRRIGRHAGRRCRGHTRGRHGSDRQAARGLRRGGRRRGRLRRRRRAACAGAGLRPRARACDRTVGGRRERVERRRGRRLSARPARGRSPAGQAGAEAHGQARGSQLGRNGNERHDGRGGGIRSAGPDTGTRIDGRRRIGIDDKLERLRRRGVWAVSGPARASATRCRPRRAVKRCTAVVALALSVALVSPAAAGASIQPTDLRVDGGEESWHRGQLFALYWSNPPGVAAVHYRLLDPGGDVLVANTLDWAATWIDHLSVPPVPGAYTAQVWLKDTGGAQGPAVSAKLRFDDARPGAIEPVTTSAWIGRSAFPYTLRLTHPSDPLPISGIRGYAVSVDASPTGSPCAGAGCTAAETDLQGGAGADSLPIAELPEGINYVHAVAVSGSGTSSAPIGTTVLRVDKTAPSTRIEGVPAGWARAR